MAKIEDWLVTQLQPENGKERHPFPWDEHEETEEDFEENNGKQAPPFP
jgi:hypothetical protein